MTARLTLSDLDSIPDSPTVALPPRTPSRDLDALLEIAAETDERGPMATICGLLEALRMRHAGDDTTTSILAALQHHHLPMLVAQAKG